MVCDQVSETVPQRQRSIRATSPDVHGRDHLRPGGPYILTRDLKYALALLMERHGLGAGANQPGGY
jgi:hypothetical protein